MARPKPDSPTSRVSISMPEPLLRAAGAAAKSVHLSLSAWIASLIREAMKANDRQYQKRVM